MSGPLRHCSTLPVARGLLPACISAAVSQFDRGTRSDRSSSALHPDGWSGRHNPGVWIDCLAGVEPMNKAERNNISNSSLCTNYRTCRTEYMEHLTYLNIPNYIYFFNTSHTLLCILFNMFYHVHSVTN